MKLIRLSISLLFILSLFTCSEDLPILNEPTSPENKTIYLQKYSGHNSDECILYDFNDIADGRYDPLPDLGYFKYHDLYFTNYINIFHSDATDGFVMKTGQVDITLPQPAHKVSLWVNDDWWCFFGFCLNPNYGTKLFAFGEDENGNKIPLADVTSITRNRWHVVSIEAEGIKYLEIRPKYTSGRYRTLNHMFDDLEICYTVLNQPPVADAGQDQVLECSGDLTSVTLNATGSYDPDESDIITFEWILNGALISDQEVATLNLPADEYNFKLRVTDGQGDSSQDEVNIKIIDTTPPEINYQIITTEIWPPNNKMVLAVENISAIDTCCTSELFIDVIHNQSVSNKKNEPYYKLVQNNIGYFDLYLKASRNGDESSRVYTVTIKAADCHSNTMNSVLEFLVPHDKRNIY